MWPTSISAIKFSSQNAEISRCNLQRNRHVHFMRGSQSFPGGSEKARISCNLRRVMSPIAAEGGVYRSGGWDWRSDYIGSLNIQGQQECASWGASNKRRTCFGRSSCPATHDIRGCILTRRYNYRSQTAVLPNCLYSHALDELKKSRVRNKLLWRVHSRRGCCILCW